MQEKLKEIPKKLLEYWNKWTTKQKSLIIGISVGVILLIAVLVFLISRVRYVELGKYDSTEVASQAVTILNENQIKARLGDDNLTVYVDENSYVNAVVAVSNADITREGFSIDDMLNTSLTTTNGERLLRQHLRNQSQIQDAIRKFDGVEDVNVTYVARDTSNSILASNRSIPVSVVLFVNSSFKDREAEAIAFLVARAVGNPNADDVTIVDQHAKLLYNGGQENSDEMDITDKQSTLNYFRNQYVTAVSALMIRNGYTEVEVSPYLDINYDKVQELLTEIRPMEGETTGVLIEHHDTSSEGTGGNGDIPGTDPNDETDYYLTEGGTGSYSTSSLDEYYKPTEFIKETVYDVGTLNTDNCSIAVVAVLVREFTQENVEKYILEEAQTYDQYKFEHTGRHEIEAKEDLYTAVALATGIDEEKISLITYENWVFIDKEPVFEVDPVFIIQILLALILLAILVFVIVRGLKPVEITEIEPELSIEQLLATTKENQGLEDVEFSEQSETRRMIEKFFDENPESVAALLRNWLNEDWM